MADERSRIQLGLRENAGQFTLLVIVNAFVGGMIGLERSILPQIAEAEFQIAAKTALLSFIVVFGITKAVSNYFAGALANRFGRRNLLLLGWVLALPVPFVLIYAPDWNWIVACNVLLGVHQGLAWSSTVVMKIDLVGESNRGLAMGLNEFAGYIAVAAVALATGWIAEGYGLRPYPFYIGIVLAFAGLLTTVLFVRDTRHHVAKESAESGVPRLRNIFWDTTIRDRNLGSITQAGLVNNLNDGMMWGLFPLLLAVKGFSLAQIGTVAAVYPAVWGLGQIVTGKMSDHFDKRVLLFTGMLLQGSALFFVAFAESFSHFVVLSVVLGWGTAMVYPTFLSAVAEHTHPQDRAKSIGVFRLWRDLGYAIGAIITGIVADSFGIPASIVLVAVLTVASAVFLRVRMVAARSQ
ncbi:MAG TPA: MFS transporter [Pyrinomonadaceae bacterium]